MFRTKPSKKPTVSSFDLAKGYEHYGAIDLALNAYLESAKQGNAEAKARLNQFALSDNLTAKLYLGLVAENEKNWQQAQDYYQKGAAKQHAPSIYQIGQLYEVDRLSPDNSSVVIAKDLNKAFSWYRKAACLNYLPALKRLLKEGLKKPEASFQLAQMYEQGEAGFTKDLKKAFKHYQFAMQHHHAEAYVSVARLYEKFEKTDLALQAYFSAGLRGSNIAKQKLKEWSEANNVSAAFCLGIIYEKEKNWQQAKKYYQQAIVSNHAPSMYRLGQIYKAKQAQADWVKAYGLFRQAAKDYPKALALLINDAATQGEAAFQLAKMYEQGEAGLVKDGQRTFDYYALAMCHQHKAAENHLRAQATSGNPQAQYALGYGYYQQRKKIMVAIMWCMKAAEKNYAPALTYLIESKFNQIINLKIAKIYSQGNGVVKNIARAVTFYDKACRQGSVEAAFYLGGIYQAGCEGVEKNLEKAFDYALLAVKRGKQEALSILEQLGSSVNADRQLKLSEIYRAAPYEDENKSKKWYLVSQQSKLSTHASDVSEASSTVDQKQSYASLFFESPISSGSPSSEIDNENYATVEAFFKKVFLNKLQ